MYYYHPHTGRFEQGTRSVVRSSAYGPGYYSRRSYDDDALYAPYRPYHHHTYDTSGNENYTRSQVNKELLMSSAAMDDNYDISNRSRNRDREVIAAANRAIVDTELHTSPRSAVAASRVMRGHSTPPPSVRTSSLSHREVHVPLARAISNKLGFFEPPATVHHQRTRYPRVSIRPRYRRYFPARARQFAKTTVKKRDVTPDVDIDTEGLRRAPLSILAYLRNLQKALKSKRIVARPRSTYVPIRTAYKKAALLGSKVDVVLPERRHRTPRSGYAQAKVRQIHLAKGRESESPVVATETSSLRAHKPVFL